MAENAAMEARLRRAAKKKGLKILKSRARNPEDPTKERFIIVDGKTHNVLAGSGPRQFSLTIADVATYLISAPSPPSKPRRA